MAIRDPARGEDAVVNGEDEGVQVAGVDRHQAREVEVDEVRRNSARWIDGPVDPTGTSVLPLSPLRGLSL